MRHLLAIVILAALAAGCNEKLPESFTSPSPQPVTLRVTPRIVESLGVKQSVQITADVQGISIYQVTWDSSNAGIATVSRTGLVTCLAPGLVAITAELFDSTGTRLAIDAAGVRCVVAPSGTPPPPTAPDSNFFAVSPSSLSFGHLVGTTPCPQTVGSFSIINNGSQTMQVTIAAGNAALTLNRTSFEIHSGGALDVLVTFNCGTQNGFTTNVTVTGTIGTTSETSTVQVVGAITR